MTRRQPVWFRVLAPAVLLLTAAQIVLIAFGIPDAPAQRARFVTNLAWGPIDVAALLVWLGTALVAWYARNAAARALFLLLCILDLTWSCYLLGSFSPIRLVVDFTDYEMLFVLAALLPAYLQFTAVFPHVLTPERLAQAAVRGWPGRLRRDGPGNAAPPGVPMRSAERHALLIRPGTIWGSATVMALTGALIEADRIHGAGYPYANVMFLFAGACVILAARNLRAGAAIGSEAERRRIHWVGRGLGLGIPLLIALMFARVTVLRGPITGFLIPLLLLLMVGCLVAAVFYARPVERAYDGGPAD